jgi:outer membrane protein TolC
LAASRFDHFDSRIDFDAIAVWSLHNAGVGNVAASRQRRSELGSALFEQQRVLDQISREVSEALALIKARRAQIDAAQRQLATAERAYKLDLERARQLEGRPIELLDSARLLADARRDRIQAMVGFNQAQFRLFVALGNTP